MPIIAIISPKNPESMPFRSDCVETLAMIVSPNTISAKYSTGPNLSAIFASCGAMKIRHSVEMMPPMVEAIAATPSALPALPCCAMG